jgi:type I restriction enzyme S subunit
MFTPSSETPDDIGRSAVVMEDLPNTVFSYHLVRLRPRNKILVPEFSAYAFQNYSFYKKLWRLAQGATRFTLSLDSFNKVLVLIPKSLIEQEMIGNFLLSLDKVIESKDLEIANVERWKKGLMQQLFI